MHDEVEMPHVTRQRLDHVLPHELEVRMRAQGLEPFGHAARVIVVDDRADAGAGRARVVPVQHRLDQVVAEEAAAARDQEPPAAHPAELFREVGTERLQVVLQQLREGHQRFEFPHVFPVR